MLFGKAMRIGMACVAVAVAAAADAHAAPVPSSHTATTPVERPAAPAAPPARPRLDRSGRKRVGTASVYAGRFSGRRMADGTRMDPQDDSAASKTLPLGSTAKVTNLATGQSAVVTIRDRGPYAKGRILDLSPAAADKVGIDRREGVSKVEVTPIDVPPQEHRAAPSAAQH